MDDPSGMKSVKEAIQQGQHSQALKICDQIIQSKADNADKAHFYKGLIFHFLGDINAAIASYQNAIASNEKYAEALYCLASLLKKENQLSDAEKYWQQCIDTNPTYIKAHIALSQLAIEKNDSQKAESYLLSALQNEPQDETLREFYLTHFDPALRIHAIKEKNENNSDANLKLALLHDLAGDTQKAIQYFNQAIDNEHHFSVNTYNYFGILANNNQFDTQEVVKVFKKGIEQYRNEWTFYNNLAHHFKKKDDFKNALLNLQSAIELAPKESSVYLNLSLLYRYGHQYEKTLESAKQCLELDPHNISALSLLINAAQNLADWDLIDASFPKLIQTVNFNMKNNIPIHWPSFNLLSLPINNQAYCQIMQYKKTPSPKNKFEHPKPKQKKRLRIGYLSPDFTTGHPIGLLIKGLLKHHNREKFETFAYSLREYPKSNSQEVNACFEHYIPLADQSDKEAAKIINDHEIDILVDLAGYTRNAREGILLLQPAPLQIQYLGYTASMQADYIQYHISCKEVIPESLQAFFTEKLIYLPEGNVATEIIPAPPTTKLTRKDYGLPDDAFVFCNFARTERVDKQSFKLWMEILNEVSESVLWLYSANESTINHLRQYARTKNIDPSRLIFTKSRKLSETWQHSLADLWLDSLSISAGTGAIFCASAGLPLLTLAGETPQSRMGAGIATSANLKNMIAESIQQYKEMAIDLGTHPEKLATIKTKILRQQKTMPLFQPHLFVRYLEKAYEMVWKQWMDDQSVKNILVER